VFELKVLHLQVTDCVSCIVLHTLIQLKASTTNILMAYVNPKPTSPPNLPDFFNALTCCTAENGCDKTAE